MADDIFGLPINAWLLITAIATLFLFYCVYECSQYCNKSSKINKKEKNLILRHIDEISSGSFENISVSHVDFTFHPDSLEHGVRLVRTDARPESDEYANECARCCKIKKTKKGRNSDETTSTSYGETTTATTTLISSSSGLASSVDFTKKASKHKRKLSSSVDSSRPGTITSQSTVRSINHVNGRLPSKSIDISSSIPPGARRNRSMSYASVGSNWSAIDPLRRKSLVRKNSISQTSEGTSRSSARPTLKTFSQQRSKSISTALQKSHQDKISTITSESSEETDITGRPGGFFFG